MSKKRMPVAGFCIGFNVFHHTNKARPSVRRRPTLKMHLNFPKASIVVGCYSLLEMNPDGNIDDADPRRHMSQKSPTLLCDELLVVHS